MIRRHIETGLRIREARVVAGLSQKDLAAALDVTVQSVSQWENGRSQPETDRLIEMAGILGVSWNWIKLGTGPKEPATIFPLEHRSAILKRVAPVWDNKKPLSVLLKVENTLDRFDENTIIAQYPAKGFLFSVYASKDYEDYDILFGDLLIFDTGVKPTAASLVFAQVTKSEMAVAQVRSLALDDDGAITASLRLLGSSREISSKVGTGNGIVAAMVEQRRFMAS